MNLDCFARHFVNYRLLADSRHKKRSADGNNSLTETGEGSCNRRKDVSFPRITCKRRNHRPIRNIGKGVRHTPENISHGNINHDADTAQVEGIAEKED